jgi:hypothetical protein
LKHSVRGGAPEEKVPEKQCGALRLNPDRCCQDPAVVS